MIRSFIGLMICMIICLDSVYGNSELDTAIILHEEMKFLEDSVKTKLASSKKEVKTKKNLKPKKNHEESLENKYFKK